MSVFNISERLMQERCFSFGGIRGDISKVLSRVDIKGEISCSLGGKLVSRESSMKRKIMPLVSLKIRLCLVHNN